MFRLIRIILMLGVLFTGHSIDPDMISELAAKIKQSKTRDADLARLRFSGAPQASESDSKSAAPSIRFLAPPSKTDG